MPIGKSIRYENALQGDTGKCTHFPYLMFSIIKINSDHIIEKLIGKIGRKKD